MTTKAPAAPPRFALGHTVRFRQCLVRRAVQETHGGRLVSCLHWLPEPFPRAAEGVVVGVRTKFNGYKVWIGSEEGMGFTPTGHRRVYLVATSLFRAPVVVGEEDMEALP